MINEKKIRLMTRAAMIEERDKKGIFISKKFYFNDYVIFQTLKAVIGMTVAYAFVVLFIFLYHIDDINESSSANNIITQGKLFIFIYIGVLIVTVIITILACYDSFKESKLELREYNRIIRTLNKENTKIEEMITSKKGEIEE